MRFKASAKSVLLGAAILGGIGGVASFAVTQDASPTTASDRFTLCHTGGGVNCVVDGDTIWLRGEKIRIADVDAPETHQPRCQAEADLGRRATLRLLDLVNEAPFIVKQSGARDEDRYGRKLRVLVRDGRSLGDQLVVEGFARPWGGARRPWC